MILDERTDVLVIGSGIAGLCFALKAARFARVAIVTKKDRPESSTNYAQGGVAAVFGSDDEPALHARDTIVAGAGLCHRDAVEALVSEGPDRIRELIEIGVRFSREQGALSLGREGGHSRRRIVRADDLTGREIERALLDAVATAPTISLYENHTGVDLLLAVDEATGAPRCLGAAIMSVDPAVVTNVRANAVVLATGGCGQVYRHTTNPAIATGDGIAMAYRAGAVIANMEFVQFHPTALYPASERTFLISEAVRGEGAVLRRSDGSEFMEGQHPLGSLAPRDVVARAIDAEMKRTGDAFVLLDCSAIPQDEIRARFPNILRETASRGVDMLREPIPVVPAAHYLCGGVLTDSHGRTTLPGLIAIGEVACTGVHGANRLASNSLLEALVFAHRAAVRLQEHLPDQVDGGTTSASPPPARAPSHAAVHHALPSRDEVRSLMWEFVGIVRTDERLRQAAARLSEIDELCSREWIAAGPSPELLELRNLVDVARLIVECAQQRTESRGLHFNVDHPNRDNEHFLRDTLVSRAPSVPVGR